MQAGAVRIGHLGIVVGDLERAIDFYTRVGLRLTERFEYAEEIGHGVAVSAAAFMRCDEAHHSLSIFTLRNLGRSPDDRPLAPERELGYGLHHIAFELTTPENLLAKYRQLKEAGAPIVSARRGGPGNQPRFYARDPDGHLLEFYWGIDRVDWEDGRLPRFDPVEEIDLEQFDFEGFAREQRDRALIARAG